MRSIRKQQEYGYIHEKTLKSKISQIQNIADLQHLTFSDAFQDILDVGITFRNNNYSLQSRALKIRALDNMLLQIYPFLNKEYQNNGENVAIFDKMIHFYVDLSPILLQKKGFLSKETCEVVETDAYSAFKYVKNNFPDEYKSIKSFLMNDHRNKHVKALFNAISTTHQGTQNSISNNNEKIDNESQRIHEKFKKGFISKGKYQKNDGTFGESEIEFPPLKS